MIRTQYSKEKQLSRHRILETEYPLLQKLVSNFLFGKGNIRDFIFFNDVYSENNDRISFSIYTDTNCYNITARKPKDDDKVGYLGCGVSRRKPNAGENWNRGNDLPDGPYSEETWEKILQSIVRYELVPLNVRWEEDRVSHDEYSKASV